jgi:hypothetical protein
LAYQHILKGQSSGDILCRIPSIADSRTIREHYSKSARIAFYDHQFLDTAADLRQSRKGHNELAHALLERFGSLDGAYTAEAKSSQIATRGRRRVIFDPGSSGAICSAVCCFEAGRPRGEFRLNSPFRRALRRFASSAQQPMNPFL